MELIPRGHVFSLEETPARSTFATCIPTLPTQDVDFTLLPSPLIGQFHPFLEPPCSDVSLIFSCMHTFSHSLPRTSDTHLLTITATRLHSSLNNVTVHPVTLSSSHRPVLLYIIMNIHLVIVQTFSLQKIHDMVVNLMYTSYPRTPSYPDS